MYCLYLCVPYSGLPLCFPDCPPCYSLVQERVNIHRGKLRELNNIILNIGNDPTAFNDTQFLVQLTQVNDSVNILLNEAKGATSKYIWLYVKIRFITY